MIPGLTRLAGAVVFLAAAPSSWAQPQPSQPPPPAARPRAVDVMTLESPAWTDGGLIPARHAQTGRDVSPPLRWSGAPDGTLSFVLLVHDVDQVAPGGGDDLLHWLVWNIPGSAGSLDEGMAQGNGAVAVPQGGGGGRPRIPTDGPRQISASGPYYRGPAAPATGPPHHYVFELLALDTWLDVPAVGQSPAATRAAVLAATVGHVRAKGVLTGRYRRPAP
ncbi:MAG: YbhB/YbcL family Raf kinase inhibitor-like protein [Vicinamibacterales bacterium]